MMTLPDRHPCINRLTIGKHDSRYSAPFGMPYAITVLQHVAGAGHDERLRIACYGGLHLDVSRAFALELARRLPEAIAHMPFSSEDIHDAAGDF